jgi:hypothetical protein
MERKSVVSSYISEVGYDESTKKLQIQFVNGTEWEYENVPKSEYEQLLTAQSVGRYFSGAIRGFFNGKKIEKED